MSLLNSLKSIFTPAPRVEMATATAKVRAGHAVFVDVREPNEWAGGVAQHAALLPLSDLTGARKRWRDFLGQHRDRELYVYCASGMRSNSAARILLQEGLQAANVGGLGNLAAAGWPIVRP